MKIFVSIFGAYALAVIAHYYFTLNVYIPVQSPRAASKLLQPSSPVAYCSDKELRSILLTLDQKIMANKTYVTEQLTKLNENIQAANARQSHYPISQIEKFERTKPKLADQGDAVPATVLREDTIVTLDEQMLAEKEDIQWETQAKDDIRDFFSELGEEAPSLDDSYCSGKICRLEISYADEQQLALVFNEEHSLVAWPHKGKTFDLADSGDRKRQLIYLINTDTR